MKEQTTRTPPKLRVLSAFLAVAMLLTLLPAAAFAAPAPESDFEYGASNGRAIIRKYKGAGGTVEIPATLGGSPVTGIKMQAFIEGALTSLSTLTAAPVCTLLGPGTPPAGTEAPLVAAFSQPTSPESAALGPALTADVEREQERRLFERLGL